MPTIRRFEELNVWQEARHLTQEIYRLSKTTPFAKDFALRDQIRKACISVMSNIAEGFEREGKPEFLQFLSITKGSLGEVRSQLYTALDQEYISQEEFDRLNLAADTVRKLTVGMINYLKRSPIRGQKHKP